MAIPKIKAGDVVTAFGVDCVVMSLDEESRYDLVTDRGCCRASDVTKLVRRTVIGWRHYSGKKECGSELVIRDKAHTWKHLCGGRVFRVIRKRTWRNEGAK